MSLSSVPRVLVVDDYPESARVLGQLLRLYGFEAFLAYDGASALALASELAPDAVVLDLVLPDIDGAEVARQLRAHAATRASVLVALTGYAPEDTRSPVPGDVFDFHMVKPVTPSELRDLLLHALTQSAAPTG